MNQVMTALDDTDISGAGKTKGKEVRRDYCAIAESGTGLIKDGQIIGTGICPRPGNRSVGSS
jgi:hypothetical protein